MAGIQGSKSAGPNHACSKSWGTMGLGHGSYVIKCPGGTVMDVGKGWGKGTGDALPSAPQQQPALARAEGSSTGLQSWMERVYGRAVNLLVTALSPPFQKRWGSACGCGCSWLWPWGWFWSVPGVVRASPT